ncbi:MULTISPECIES: alpha-D-ribose 1-methylphosphonate 5-triphosphate diphosphatase [unclassified Marinovum]
MSVLSLPLRITEARILCDTGFAEGALTLADGRITDGPAPEIALPGYDILPGIVDACAQRPATGPLGNLGDLSTFEASLAAQGITTAGLVLDWGWQTPDHSPDAACALLAALAKLRKQARTDLRVMLRCDTHMMDSEALLLSVLDSGLIDAVLFVDTLGNAICPATREMRKIADTLRNRSSEVHRFLCNLAHAFDQSGLRSGSYGDRDGQARERLAMMGAKICVAPAGQGAAEVARAWGDPVLMPAQGVLQGSGVAGAPATRDLIAVGMCDALVSDGTPEALARAALRLARVGALPMAGAWSLIASRPAGILGLKDRGRLVPGQRADLVVLHRASGRIAATMAAGRWIWRNPEFALPFQTLARQMPQGISTPRRSTVIASAPRSS